MALNKFELRFNNNIDMKTTNDGLLVSGYVNKTNQWSQTLGQRKKFVERILPGAFRKALQNGNEIHFLAEHDNNKILATTRNDSLTLREDDNGLYMEARISPTSWGKDYHQLITDGIIKNMSFGMAVLKDKWDKLADGTYERSISDLALFEVSAVRNPAYVQSTIAARSIEVIEDVEIPEEKAEKRELTLQEQIKIKKANLNKLKMVIDVKDSIDVERVKKAEGEIGKMEAKLNKQTTATTADNLEKQESRTLLANSNTGKTISPIQLVWEKAKKMDGQDSVVARTNIVVQTGRKLDTFLEDASNATQNSFKGEMEDLNLGNYNGAKVTIEAFRTGKAIEVSELLLEKSAVEQQETSYENKLRREIENDTNYSMLTGDGNMDNLTADTSVSIVIQTEDADSIAMNDMFELTDSLNQSYQENAVYIMHKNTLRKLRKNKEFTADYLKREVDKLTGKMIYHFDGRAIVVNNSIDEKYIVFGNLYDGYKTLISTGPEPSLGQDIYGNTKMIDQRSFVLQKTYDATRAMKKMPVYVMQAYIGGKVINKDCFVRLDVKTI